MTLPAPYLDDRRFQDFVDDAKRLVQQRCPEWTDHNVSDPGVTLIEAVAQMADQLVYRLNRVPERHYVKFLELLGVRLRPPAAARSAATFWLSAPQPDVVVVRADTEVATPRTDVEDAVAFATLTDLRIIPCSRAQVGAMRADGEPTDDTTALDFGSGFACFAPRPVAGDALLVGLSAAVPSCVVLVRVDCTVEGRGIDPLDPPLIWEAWTGTAWSACEVESDGTGGFNRPGDVIVHVPPGHRTSVLARQRAGWLRCRVVARGAGAPAYVASPWITGLTAVTIGGTVATIQAEPVRNEEIGVSDGTPAQRFALQRSPVVPWEETARLLVTTPVAESGRDQAGLTATGGRTDAGAGNGVGADVTVGVVEEWTEVDSFAYSRATDRHFRLDPAAAEVEFGPAVREADGSLRGYGAIPAKGSRLQVVVYRAGGGRRGNVARGQVRVLKTSVPYVSRVENRAPGTGGAEAETVENAKVRGPLTLRTRGRAVTAEDFEELARDVAPDVARVACRADDAAGGVRLLVVPHVARDEIGRIRRGDLDPEPALLQRIAGHLDARRLIGTRLVVEPPEYLGLTVVVDVTARRGRDAGTVRDDVLRAVYRLFDPAFGGPEGTGWPFGRAVRVLEIHAALQQVTGVDLSRETTVQLFPADPGSRRRGAAVERLELSATALVYSFDHQVRVRP